MNLDSMTIGELKQLQSLLSGGKSSAHPYKIGQNYFIRTVTHHFTGKLVQVTEHELVLENAAWIADDGRFADALAKGSLNEIEPYPVRKVILGRGSLIDASIWKHALPREQK